MKKLTDKQSSKILLVIATRGSDLNLEMLTWLFAIRDIYPKMQVAFFRNHMSALNNYARIQQHMVSTDKYTHLLLVDSDVIPPLNVIEILYRKRKDFVSAPGWFMDNNRGIVHHNIQLEHPGILHNTDVSKLEGLIECVHVGFPVALISKKVFDAFDKEPMFAKLGEYGYPYETDVVFCNEARAKGFKLYVDCDVKGLKHYTKVELSDKMVDNLRNVQVFDTRRG